MFSRICLWSFLLFSESVSAQSNLLKGTVKDAASGEPLAFVSVVAKKNPGLGTTTDIDGKFQINRPVGQILFSYVGYETLYLSADSISDPGNIQVYLKRTSYNLQEIVILPGENPAHRIIRQVIANRDKNNPEKLDAFSYTSYNKMIFTSNIDSHLYHDVSKRELLDSNNLELLDYFDKRHLMVMEFLSEKKFMKPDRESEKILASRVSGLKNPAFTMLATQMQSFGFYNDYISIYDRNYLNPVSGGSINRYHFQIEDTTFAGTDTVFIISYRPRKNKNFDGMKGLLYINTNGYAIQNVIAEPFQKTGEIDVKIQQKYELIDDKAWFPVQLNTDISYDFIKFSDDFHVVGLGRSYIDSIRINPDLPKRIFNEVVLDVDQNAHRQTEELWKVYRTDSLDDKEKSTYEYVDSIGEADNLELKVKIMESLMKGYLPFKFTNIELDQLLRYNEYEGFRAGLGLHTNRDLSRLFSVGGYGAYGFRDKAFKYGGNVRFFLLPRHQLELKGGYRQDVVESGAVSLSFDKPNWESQETFRNYYVRKMDRLTEKFVALSFRTMKYMDIEIGANTQIRETTDDYYFLNRLSDDIVQAHQKHYFTEASLGFRYAFREKFYRYGEDLYSLGTDYPVIWGKIVKGFDDLLDGQHDYWRFDLKIAKKLTITNFGKQNYQVRAGYILGNLPYTALYNGNANYSDFSIVSENNFETMRMNEFLSNRYLSFFFSHDFGKLLFRTEKFQPGVKLAHNMGIGTINNIQNHQGLDFSSMEKGYFESGLILNNLLNIGFTGLGLGCFYRYGPQAFDNATDNFAFKLSVSWVL